MVATVAVAEIGVVLMATEAEAELEAVDLGVPFGGVALLSPSGRSSCTLFVTGAVLRSSSKLSLALLKLEEEG